MKMQQSRSNTIGIIGGTGWLGYAIAVNLLQKNFISPDHLWISNRSGNKEKFTTWPTVHLTTNNQELVNNSDIIILCVLPQHFNVLQIDATNKIILSVMAGVSIDKIKESTKSNLVIRAMPNAAAEIGLSYTPWVADVNINADISQKIQSLLSCIGMTDKLDDEDQINFFTALTGSGHGVVAYFENAMIQAAINKGIDKNIAERAIKQLFLGISKLIIESKQNPAKVIAELIDYAGTTAAALTSFNHAEINFKIAQGVENAYKKAASDMASDK